MVAEAALENSFSGISVSLIVTTALA